MSTTAQHPYGLRYLFLTELWERFGYYLMIGIFILYMEDTAKGGLGFASSKSTDIFGTFIALAYLTPFLGGIVADKLLGYRKSIIIGGTLMGIGYCCLGITDKITLFFSSGFGIDTNDATNYALWFSLIVMVIGNGFFKPNIATLLGNLYNDPKYSAKKDIGYNIFYMGINIGAFICNFAAAYMRGHFGWWAAFLCAGGGMFLGVITFIAGNKHYEHADAKKVQVEGEKSLLATLGVILVPAVLSGIIGWYIPGNIFSSDSTDAFLFFTFPVIAYFLNILKTAPAHEKQPIKALLAIYAVAILFWAIFKQNGTALTGWAERYTNREIPTAVVPAAEVFGFTQNLTNATGNYPKYDSAFRTEKDEHGKVIKAETTHPYFINAPEKLPADGQELSLISTEIFQSINPFFIIIFTPMVIAFFAWMRRKNREPSTATKIGWGLMITSLSSLVMVFACWACHNGLEKASPMWLVGTYGVVTIGELCLSPMGLSLVSKLAPARIAAVMMGGWQLATAIGNKMSGVLAGLWNNFDNKEYYFLMNTGLTFVAGLMIFAMLKWLNRVIAEHVKQ